MTTRFVYVRAPGTLGEIIVAAAGDALCGVWFAGQKYAPSIDGAWRKDPGTPILREALAQLAAYFAGARTRFELPLAPQGTPFQRDVWQAIAQVGFGETATYGELAARIGRTGSARAAGAATGRNPLSIVVPCHRIVGSSGALTGYAGGLERKRALLAHEQVVAAALRRAA